MDIGGIYFQLILNVILYGLYLYTGESALLFTIAAVVAMSLYNLNPMFKYDGYWALSDAIGVPNLHKRVGDLWRQILPIPGKKRPSVFFQTHAYARVVVCVYALATTAYFSYFAWMMIWLAPKAVRDYPGLLVDALTQAWQNLLTGQILATLGDVFRILFPTILLIGLFLLVKRFASALYRLGKGGVSLMRRWQQSKRDGEKIP